MCEWLFDIITLYVFGGLVLPLRGMFTFDSHIPNLYFNIGVMFLRITKYSDEEWNWALIPVMIN
jgi:hypothetical protein